ncbi:nucleotidyl transferase AbiEii/AbiGii toxin family protein [Exilibacterium tricleocarpae]|uniref:Nucleotidyl transferase AbiEii/AbiGii toxin family protein n=1 Tax=Exilibacterium tricleocarpae TaxID=2591008 RepID=A0A545TFE7_9GAMM|nr:nucleotidyl transferase AbiEii/AbiGii toxin family protein [Exilibacterium tricleocarpae]TQV75957.1 nucleotidyl transferase AbiEii/AbiGii toxin family protein [Exilibacterium tricleocarpae]
MSLTDEQQDEHVEIMAAICHTFKQKNLPMVLKGGTALKLCYGLDRFSENLDYDCAIALDLEKTLNAVFAQLGKRKPHLRNPEISKKKDTTTVRRYRIVYAGDVNLKLETSLRGTPNDDDLIERNGILTYKISRLIKQKLSALKGRTAARDLHDVVYLYEHYLGDFDNDELEDINDLYENQSDILDEYNTAYSEDTILSTSDLLSDLSKFIDLYKARNHA